MKQMNKFISIIILLSLSSISYAGEICLAHKNWKGDKSAKLNYVVKCQNTVFETKDVTVTYVLPLPFHWGKAARKFLYREMSKRKFTEVAKFIPIQKKNGSEFIHIFGKRDGRNTYCSVVKYNIKKKHSDVIVACEGIVGDMRFKGLTESEIKHHMGGRGLRKALTVNYQDYFKGHMSELIEVYKSNY